MIYIPSTIKREYRTVPNESTRLAARAEVAIAKLPQRVRDEVNTADVTTDRVLDAIDHLHQAQKDCARIQARENLPNKHDGAVSCVIDDCSRDQQEVNGELYAMASYPDPHETI